LPCRLLLCLASSRLSLPSPVGDYYDRWSEFLSEVTPLVRDGKIRFEETVMHGFDKLPEALAGLFKGVNIGKVRGR
jgi:NADPH-dependent curcumin reductase CurA